MSDKKCCHFVELGKGVLVIGVFDIVFALLYVIYLAVISIAFNGIKNDKEYYVTTIKLNIVFDGVFSLVFVGLQALMVTAVVKAWPTVMLISMGLSVCSVCVLLGRCVLEVAERYFGTCFFVLLVCLLGLYFMYVVIDYAEEMDTQ